MTAFRNDLFPMSKGSNWTMSLDGYDKLCGYQKATFPLCIYGGLDTYSNRINILRIWTTSNEPKIMGRFYLEYLYDCRGFNFTTYFNQYFSRQLIAPKYGLAVLPGAAQTGIHRVDKGYN